MKPKPRFTKLKSGYKDTTTGLIWSPTAPERMNHAGAEKWCTALGKGWRLPTVRELVGVVDYGRYDPSTELPDTQSDGYWSATSYVPHSTGAWYVGFFTGGVRPNGKTFNYLVRAVRGGL